jgi:hypothetical protein
MARRKKTRIAPQILTGLRCLHQLAAEDVWSLAYRVLDIRLGDRSFCHGDLGGRADREIEALRCGFVGVSFFIRALRIR